jgi:hypothetical protein
MDDAPKAPEPELMTRIARELATEQYTFEQVLQRYDIDQEYFANNIATNPFYIRVLADYTQEWHSLGSTHKRLAFAAAAALEEKLPGLAARMGDNRSALSDAVAAAKLFRDLAGIATPAPGAGVSMGEKFSISINFGHHKIALEASPQAEGAGLIEEKVTGTSIQHLPSRQSEKTEIRSISEGETEQAPAGSALPPNHQG